ncbi:J domain-containing protein [Geobacter sp. SVR]|uniref:J domain-containing protein n=1 Tax=Geobacter sp. SVR TaxID=2495594 RepID=UPI00143EF7A0|nr:hypothetical protein [Geobacter sp. SVR]BCS53709.1 hypothetical protein GSVR_20170 [Geobacter sp. SVR]GCF85783.1 hypothetical protein GSbR_23830 [Geobacter sp. SVR]
MTPYKNRLKTPEEIELGKKRDELAKAQHRLAEWEQAYTELKSEIRSFEQVYAQVLGARISQLEDLEWQLNGLLEGEGEKGASVSSLNEEGFTQFQHRTDLLDDDFAPMPGGSQKSLKSLYREVAKAIHPDLASDDEERLRRQELMTEANRAYSAGDRTVLEEILSEWEQGPEMVSGLDVAMELVRVIRLIARAEQNTQALIRQIKELKASDIYSFKIRVDEAAADGIDLMAEMAATVDLDIAKTRRRLAVLRGDGEKTEGTDGPPLETRLIRFPSEYSCGMLYERSSGSVDYRDWHRLGGARGVREVFLDKAVRLDVKGTTENEMRFLQALQPDDLQALFLYDINDSSLAYLSHLSGLQELYLSNTSVTDEGLCQLQALHGLRRLYIYHSAISDSGLLNLTQLSGLKWLTCSGTAITEEGLSVFRELLPACKAVSFEWRHGK